MLLAIDIGNTHIVTGLLDNTGNVLLTFRVASNDKLTEDEYFSYLRNISKFNKIDIEKINGMIVASVVPNLNPTGFGADRIIDIVQSLNDYPDKNLVIFDFGSATTYEVLEKNIYIGGGILPGIEMSINALFANTAKLPKVKFSTPDSVLGKNTIEQIQAGIFYGYAGQIKHIIKKIKEVVKDPFIIATGGLGKILSAEIEEIDVYSPDLSIKGLYTLYKYNQNL